MSLDTGRWRRVEALLDEVLDLPEPERAGHLERACGGDEALRREVERMLDACARSEGHFDTPPVLGRGIAEAWAEEAGEEARDRLSPGDRLGAYRVVELLGRGGMGAVYLAERADGAFDRRVAVKVVKRGMDTDEILDRFRKEREILARLQHPHIANLLDGGVTAAGLPFLVMELVEGEPIDTWCDRHQLDVEVRLRLFLAVCDAVRYAHRALVVHRDLKPSNILVHDGDVKLLDFGIARLLEERGTQADTRLMDRRVTPEYAAPEQIRGEPPTTSADVYALGVILYELLTGERPYRVEGSLTEVERIVSGVAPRSPSTVAMHDPVTSGGPPEGRARLRAATPSALRKRLRGDLDCIVLRALAKDPARRFGTVEALAEDIERHLEGRTVRARPDSRWYRVSTFVRRNRTAAILAALAAFGLLGGSVATTIFAVQANQERNRGQLEAERAVAARDFVVGLFAELDPDRLQGRTTFTRDELVELGMQNLDELEGQPELQATVLNTLGQVAFNLGDRERAGAFFSRAHGLLSGGATQPEVATSMMGMGEVLRRDLAFQEAEAWFRSALESRRAMLPPGDPRIAEAMVALAFVLYNQGPTHFEEAEAIYEGLASADSTVLSPRSGASVLEGLANIRGGQGRHVEAEDLYLQAIDLRVGGDPDLDPVNGRSHWGLGHARLNQGRVQDALVAYRKALDILENTYGSRHVDVAWAHLNLATALVRAGELDEAAESYARSAAANSPDDLYTAVAWQGLAVVEQQRGRLMVADSAWLRAIEIYGAHPGASDEEASARLALARSRVGRKAYDEAEPLLREVLQEAGMTGNRDREIAALGLLADLFSSSGHSDSATVYRERGAGLQTPSGAPGSTLASQGPGRS